MGREAAETHFAGGLHGLDEQFGREFRTRPAQAFDQELRGPKAVNLASNMRESTCAERDAAGARIFHQSRTH
ncbi:hypothetical protein BZY94_40140 [Burkholderia territorii]|nr:hypothetical protein BZY94_40140 [Burkholderia territorii]